MEPELPLLAFDVRPMTPRDFSFARASLSIGFR